MLPAANERKETKDGCRLKHEHSALVSRVILCLTLDLENGREWKLSESPSLIDAQAERFLERTACALGLEHTVVCWAPQSQCPTETRKRPCAIFEWDSDGRILWKPSLMYSKIEGTWPRGALKAWSHMPQLIEKDEMACGITQALRPLRSSFLFGINCWSTFYFIYFTWCSNNSKRKSCNSECWHAQELFLWNRVSVNILSRCRGNLSFGFIWLTVERINCDWSARPKER